MKFEQYIHCRCFVEHLAGAARQRALGRCSSDDGRARVPAGLGGDGAEVRRHEDRPGKRLNGHRGGAGGSSGAAGWGWKWERKWESERARVQHAGAGAANKRRAIAFRPAR